MDASRRSADRLHASTSERALGQADRLHASTSAREFSQNEQRQENHYARLAGMGLTPQEMIGAPSPGGSGGSTSSAGGASNVLGNGPDIAAARQSAQAIDLEAMRMANAKDIEALRAQTALGQSKIAADAQIEAAKTSAAPAHRDVDIREKLSEPQYQEAMNRVVTSSPRFLREMRRMSMGVENMFVEMIARQYEATGVDVFGPMAPIDVQKLTEAMMFVMTSSDTAGGAAVSYARAKILATEIANNIATLTGGQVIMRTPRSGGHHP